MPRPDALRRLFDDPSFAWAARPDQVAARAGLLRRVLPSDRSGLRMLDLGCGAGENTAALAAALGVDRPVGLDWAAPALTKAADAGVLPVQALLDGADLPFPDAAFDLVVLTEVIEHLVDTDHAVAEARRVLRPGGWFLVTTPNLAAWFNRALLLAGVQPAFSEVSTTRVYGRPGTEVVGHLRLFTRRALVAFLADAGFADLTLAGAPYHDVPRPARPLDRLLARWPEVAAGLLVAARRPA
jgi:SAM-dependent methyltransferase